jgi:hypothetical protein
MLKLIDESDKEGSFLLRREFNWIGEQGDRETRRLVQEPGVGDKRADTLAFLGKSLTFLFRGLED